MIIKLLKFFFKDKISEEFRNDSIYEVIYFRKFTINLGFKRIASELEKVLWQLQPYQTPMLQYLFFAKKNKDKLLDFPSRPKGVFSWMEDVN